MQTQHIHSHYREWKEGEAEWERWRNRCEVRGELKVWCLTSLGRRCDIPITDFSQFQLSQQEQITELKTDPSTYETLAKPQGRCNSLSTLSNKHLLWVRAFPRGAHSRTYTQQDLHLLIFHSWFQMAYMVLDSTAVTGFTVYCLNTKLMYITTMIINMG